MHAAHSNCPAMLDRQAQCLSKDLSLDLCLFVPACSETICRLSCALDSHVHKSKLAVKAHCQTVSEHVFGEITGYAEHSEKMNV